MAPGPTGSDGAGGRFATASDRATAAAAETSQPAARTPGSTRSLNWERWFDTWELDESDLLATGMPPSEVERLRLLSEKIEMERIEITHQAEREGWVDKRRYRNEMFEFERATREEIGDASYDALLYATGRENRVRVRVLLENSPSHSLGLEAGDVVLSYDGRSSFRVTDLRKAVAEGERGEWVAVDVLRNGQVVSLQGQRGHIGARFQPTRILPATLW